MIMLIQLSFALGLLLKVLKVSDIAFEGTTGMLIFQFAMSKVERKPPLSRGEK